MHPLPTKRERPAIEIMIEQKSRRVLRMAQDVVRELESLILLTPTGEPRNTLCDANIHIGEAVNYLQKATK